MYIVYSITAGLIGGAASVAIRLQLMHPGGSLFAGYNQLYNVVVMRRPTAARWGYAARR